MSDHTTDNDTLHVRVPYTPRRWQAEMHKKLKRFTVLPVHRGGGKSIFAINELVKRAMMGPVNAEYAYVLPLRNQAQRNVVDHLKRFVAPIPGVSINNASLTVRFPNGAKLYILGADNPDTLRGMHLHYLVLDEVADMHPDIWIVCRPMLTNHRGGVLFIGTPKGHGVFYDLYMLSQDPSNQRDWYGEILPYYKTGALDADEVELARQTLTTNGFQQELECFPPGSQVAVSDGIRAIEDIKPGDLVLTHTGHLRNVKGVMCKQYDGDLVVISSYGSRPLRLTPDHPVRVCDPTTQTYSWKAAKDIVPRDWLVTPKKHSGAPIISAALAELIAWFIAEGSVSQNNINIALGAHELTFVQRVKDCFTALGRRFSSKTSDENCTSITCCDVGLADFLIASCGSGAHNKRIPLSLISGHERLVFDTLIDGDGCISEERRQGYNRLKRVVYSYTTVSEQLAMQVQLLAATLDLGGTYTVRPGRNDSEINGRQINASESYHVQLRKIIRYDVRTSDAKIRTGKNGVFGKVHTVAREKYSGTVHNLSVAEDESYVVNTRAVHNCSFEAAIRGAYYGQIITDMREAGRITSEQIYRPDLDVITSWDLGVRDRTAIWFYQLQKAKLGAEVEINIIDYVAESNMGLPQWSDVLKEKAHHYGYRYGTHVAPFDIKNREFGSGISRLESAEQVGIRFEQCPAQDPMDGIELVRKHLPKCRIYAPLCYDGLEDLSMYRAKIDRQGQGLGPDHSKYSHACLVAGMLVKTERGDVPIEDVTVGMKVWTPCGYSEVLHSGFVKMVTDVIELELSDGRKVICTPEHKILTRYGFMRADTIRYGHHILTGHEWPCRLIALLSKATNIGFRAVITGETSGGQKDHPIFIAPYGKMHMAASLMGIISTISMAIHSTMTSLISPWLKHLSMLASTPNNALLMDRSNHLVRKPCGLPLYGMALKKVRYGIRKMRRSALPSVNGLNACVRFAARNISRLILRAASSATSIVRCERCVSDAVATYDLTVKHQSCYQANGVLVSNSDSLRYGITYIVQVMNAPSIVRVPFLRRR